VFASVTILVPTAAHAYSLTKSDRNDTRGPLDLAAVRLDRTGSDMTFTFRTRQRFSPFFLGQRSYFGVAFDVDLDGDADRCAFVYRPVRRLSGLFTNCRARLLNNPPVTRTGPRSIAIGLGVQSFEGSLRWGAFSFYERDEPCYPRGCFDSVPDRRSVYFDLEPPTAAWTTSLSGRNSSMQLSTTTSIPLDLELHDAQPGALDYTIERGLDVGWEAIASGSGSGPLTHVLEAEEGTSYALRLRVVDHAGNEGGSSTLRLNVPYDDSNAGAVYGAGWSPIAADGHYFAGVHASSTTGAVMTFTFTGRTLLLMGGPGNGTAQFEEVGASTGWTVSESASTQPGEVLAGLVWGPVATRTVRVEVTSGSFVIDGFGIEP
jgi:hypothetical protein